MKTRQMPTSNPEGAEAGDGYDLFLHFVHSPIANYHGKVTSLPDRYEIILHQGFCEYLTLEALAGLAGLHPALVARYVECGLLEPARFFGSQALFEIGAVTRLRAIERLRGEIGVGLTGAAVILDLTDRIRELQREVEWLRSRV